MNSYLISPHSLFVPPCPPSSVPSSSSPWHVPRSPPPLRQVPANRSRYNSLQRLAVCRLGRADGVYIYIYYIYIMYIYILNNIYIYTHSNPKIVDRKVAELEIMMDTQSIPQACICSNNQLKQKRYPVGKKNMLGRNFLGKSQFFGQTSR